MTIKPLSDRCNMTYKNYMHQPMQSVELRINFVIAKKPQLIKFFNRNKNHPLVGRYSYIH